jgi:excisionase family DNA binding protein
MERLTLTLPEVAEALGLGRNTVYTAAKRGDLPLPIVKIGKRLVVPRQAVDELLASQPAGARPGTRRLQRQLTEE